MNKLTIVKLNRTHNLHYWGFTHAFRFTRSTDDYRKLRKYFVDNYKIGEYRFFQSDARSPRWIGVKDEMMLTMAIIACSN